MRVKEAVIPAMLMVLAGSVLAQTSAPGDQFYQAIRQNDLGALRGAVRDHGVDARDAQGQTPLMLAAAFGAVETVELLVTAGADAKAASNTGVTSLHLAATDLAKTRILLDAGADVNAVSQLGRTPLIVAASANGTADVVQLLLAKRSNINSADLLGVTPLIAATVVDDAEVVRLLLAHGADANARARAGLATALMGAASNGNGELVRALLAHRPDVNAASADSSATAKNGPVQFGRVTALHLAVLSGSRDVVRQLLTAGAEVNARDIRGMTPLMFAVATDRPHQQIAELLLEAGADPTVRSHADEDTVDWVRKFENPAILATLKLQPARSLAATGASGAARLLEAEARSPRAAVERAVPLLRTASGRMLADGGCVACHAQPLTGLAINLARRRGWTTESADRESGQALTQVTAAAPGLLQLREGGGLPDGLVYVALLLAAEGKTPTRATDTVVRYLAAKQRRDGSWAGVGGTRAPMQDGDVSRTALSIKAMVSYATPALAADYAARVRRAATWLEAQTVVSNEDRVMQLLGLHWAGADSQSQRTRVQTLLATQGSDGGWAQTPYLERDAYATGQALYALREVGVSAGDGALQRGALFLLRTQQVDGSWHVKSRAMKVQPYFESGFPHGHDQWISHAGTAWAALALTATAD